MPNRPYDLPASTATPKSPLSPLHPASPLIPDSFTRLDYLANPTHPPSVLTHENLSGIGGDEKIGQDDGQNNLLDDSHLLNLDFGDDSLLHGAAPDLWGGNMPEMPDWDILPQSDSEEDEEGADDGMGWDNLTFPHHYADHAAPKNYHQPNVAEDGVANQKPSISRVHTPSPVMLMESWDGVEATEENILNFFSAWDKYDSFQDQFWSESMWGLLTAGLRSRNEAIAGRGCILLNRALGMPHKFADSLSMHGSEMEGKIRAQIFEAVIVHLGFVNGRAARWNAVKAFVGLLEGSPQLRENISKICEEWVVVVHISLLFQSTRIRRDLLRGLALILSASAANRLQSGELVVPIIKTLTEIITDLVARANMEKKLKEKERSSGLWSFHHRESPVVPVVYNEAQAELVGYACHCLKWLFTHKENAQIASPWLTGEATLTDSTPASVPLGTTLCCVMQLMGGEAFVVQHVGLLAYHMVLAGGALAEQPEIQKLAQLLREPIPHTGHSTSHPDEQARVNAFRAARRGFVAIESEMGKRGLLRKPDEYGYENSREHGSGRRNSRNNNGHHHSGYQHVSIPIEEKSKVQRVQSRW